MSFTVFFNKPKQKTLKSSNKVKQEHKLHSLADCLCEVQKRNIILFCTQSPFRLTQVKMTEYYLWDFKFSNQCCKRFKSREMWYRVTGPVVLNISEDHSGSKKPETNCTTKCYIPEDSTFSVLLIQSSCLNKFTKKSPSTRESTQSSQLISGSNHNTSHAVKFDK